MPGPSPSPTPARILDAALGLFATRGYDATSVREICEAAAVTKPTLYHFFHSKDGVFRAIVGGTLQQMHDDVLAALDRQHTLEAQLRDIVRTAFAAARRNPRLWRFVFGTVWSPTSAPVDEMHRRYEAMTATLASALERGVARGELAPGPVAVRLLVLIGSVSEALSSFLILGRPELSNELADALVEAMVSGWRPRPDVPRPGATAGPDLTTLSHA
ncbi:MAG: TetR/AcrR family transcriptional regulator [Vicinamibacterales bacterium]|nr:TetR/AcrR family transcriptional regulator [Vicinamibacterales bacterium]